MDNETGNRSWCERAWESIRGIYDEILALPFVTMLAEGTLPRESFGSYLRQDVIYLANYAHEMELIVGMLPEGRLKELYAQFAMEGMAAEAGMYERFCGDLSYGANGRQAAEAAEVTKAYISHTNACVDSGSLAVAMAALLPCTWLYNEVGKRIRVAMKGGASNPYSEWINCYDSPLQDEGARLSCELCDALASQADGKLRQEMSAAFIRSAEFEREFWAAPDVPDCRGCQGVRDKAVLSQAGSEVCG